MDLRLKWDWFKLDGIKTEDKTIRELGKIVGCDSYRTVYEYCSLYNIPFRKKKYKQRPTVYDYDSLYELGTEEFTLTEIADFLGCKQLGTVLKYLNRHGLKFKKEESEYTSYERANILESLDWKNKTIVELSEETGFTQGSLYNYAYSKNIPICKVKTKTRKVNDFYRKMLNHEVSSENLTIDEIMQLSGKSRSSCYQFLQKYGLKFTKKAGSGRPRKPTVVQ